MKCNQNFQTQYAIVNESIVHIDTYTEGIPLCINNKHTLYAVHFNWLHGHEKLVKIKELQMWYLVEEDEEEL